MNQMHLHKIVTFEDWILAVKAEYKRLADVSLYLNEEGKARKAAFYTLIDMAGFCTSANELIEWIDSKDDFLDDQHAEILESRHAQFPINKLRRVAEQEVAA